MSNSAWWWPALIGVHAGFFLLLWRFRRQDHPWLIVLYGVQWGADVLGYLVFPAKGGGLDVLGAASGCAVLKVTQLFLYNSAWLSFWVVVAMAAERLHRGLLRRVWWYVLPVVAVVMLLVHVLRGTGHVSRVHYLATLHFVVEPALLVYSIYYLVRYSARCLKELEKPDLLVLALMLECTNLILRLSFAIRPDLLFDRHFGPIFHVVCLLGFFGYYLREKWRGRQAT
ncbi:hypothetical protein ACFL51_01670 [Myxococcota bacterium]